ncbi:hypothetical protein SAMN05444008_11716 [Cnuella takakiae]|uniref:Uncharacterized protein n=1 Tax=Cnuella takakiae TaxID=1302690 RepID=A0A1M5GQP8_9BACT|nr:hypothetical protein [Cnuella takakiae]OLY90927.1 hypothetical protein BUE76_02700 [Cnuella takakiae]SHG05921.1 hypothetical protein SAMN05444008_11716 [Cnuella takakiae]
MPQPVHQDLLALLIMTYNKEVKDFYYFPEVILVGRTRLEPEAFQQMLQGGWLQQCGADSFGRYYRLSAKAETTLMQYRRKRKPAAPVQQKSTCMQGGFCFETAGNTSS